MHGLGRAWEGLTCDLRSLEELLLRAEEDESAIWEEQKEESEEKAALRALRPAPLVIRSANTFSTLQGLMNGQYTLT